MTAPARPAPAAALDVLRAWNAAIRRKDLDALRQLMADGIEIELPFHEPGRTDRDDYRVYSGTDACLGFWRDAFAQEGKVHRSRDVEVSVIGDGARIFVEFQGDVTMRSGRPYRNRYVIRYDLIGGRISRCREYYNPIQSAYAFGRLVAGKHLIDAL